MSYLNYP
jgi:hypothetical protein